MSTSVCFISDDAFSLTLKVHHNLTEMYSFEIAKFGVQKQCTLQ